MFDRREESGLIKEVGTTPAGQSVSVSAKVANADGAGTDCFTSSVESPVKPVFFGGRAQASTSGNLRGS